MTEPTTHNAIITDARLSTADHGLLSAWIMLDYGDSSGQGFGGYCLFSPGSARKGDANYAGLFIWRVLEIAGVSEWAQLPGKVVRARSTHDKVYAIGHVTKNDWFDPQVEFASLRTAVVTR